MYPRLLTALLSIFLFSISVKADNLITSGSATLTPFNPITRMSFSGSGFSVSATGDGFGGSGFLPCMSGCTAGSTLTLSANSGFWGFSDVTGSMTINGTVFRFVSQPTPTLANIVGSGSLGFIGGSVVIPITNDPFVTLTAPFSLSGFSSLGGSALDGRVGLAFMGSGTGTLTLRNLGNGQFIATNITYTFEPVPEPATVILLSSGLIGITALYRRRRDRK